MPLSFANATGNLFNRLGKLAKLISQMRSYQAAQLTNLVDVTTGAVAQYNAEADIQAIIGDSYISLLDSPGDIGSMAQQVAASTVNRMVFRDNPQIAQDLQTLNIETSLREIIRQMNDAGATVLAMTITATPGAFTGMGDGVVVASIRRPEDGLVLENALAENIKLECTADSYVSGASAGNEALTVTGTGDQSNPFAFNWPLGSNGQISINAINGNDDNSAGNLLTNSGFGAFTADVPDNWELEVGTAGTNTDEETSIVYDSGSALRIIGAGGTLTTLSQKFDDSAGTSGALEPLTQYAFNVFARRDGTAAATGTLTVELTDENGTVLQDEAGNANSFNIDLTALTTVYTAYNGTFRTPRIMPENGTYLRLRLSVALENGRSVYLDRSAFGEMSQLYLGGPYLACFSGSVPFIEGDFATVAVTNSRGAAGTLDTFQTAIARLIPEMLTSDLLLPSSDTPTIIDATLIA